MLRTKRRQCTESTSQRSGLFLNVFLSPFRCSAINQVFLFLFFSVCLSHISISICCCTTRVPKFSGFHSPRLIIKQQFWIARDFRLWPVPRWLVGFFASHQHQKKRHELYFLKFACFFFFSHAGTKNEI
jgi:hypothetical protein